MVCSHRSIISTRAKQLPLPFEASIIDELLHKDSLLVLGSGLPTIRLAALFVAAYYKKLQDENNFCVPLILVLGLRDLASFKPFADAIAALEILKTVPTGFIGPELNIQDRVSVYSGGGLYGATARTFVVDALSEKLIPKLIDGILIFDCQKLIRRTNDIFLLQLLKNAKADFFVQSFCSDPADLCKGFALAERTMRLLRISNLVLLPRVAPSVAGVLDSPAVIPAAEEELLELSPSALNCYNAIVSLVSKGVRDLKKAQPSLPEITSSAPHAKVQYLKQLAQEISDTMEPIWHRLRPGEKRIIKTTETSTSGIDPSWFLASEFDVLFANAKSRVFSASRNPVTRQPEFKLVLEAHPKLIRLQELVSETLRELGAEKKEAKDSDDPWIPTLKAEDGIKSREVRILVVSSAEITSRQAKDTLAYGPVYPLLQSLKLLLQRERWVEAARRKKAGTAADAEPTPQSMFVSWLNAQIEQLSRSRPSSIASVAEESVLSHELNPLVESLGLSNVLQCQAAFVTVGPDDPVDTLEQSIVDFVPDCIILTTFNLSWLRQTESAVARLFFSYADLVKRAKAHLVTALAPADEVPSTIKTDDSQTRKRKRAQGSADVPSVAAKLLKLSEVDLNLPTDLSSFAGDLDGICKGPDVRVVNLGCIGTSEEFNFVESLQSEQSAWDNLIHQKDTLLVFTKDTDIAAIGNLDSAQERLQWMLKMGGEQNLGSSRKAGGGVAKVVDDMRTRLKKLRLLHSDVFKLDVVTINKMTKAQLVDILRPTVLIDVREFRSALPSQLYTAGLRIVPLTLPVADYILTRETGVERKALPDLIQSLASGRLYHQCERLVRNFAHPVLLIEFDSSNRGFIRHMITQTSSDGQKVTFHHSNFRLNAKNASDMDSGLIIAKLAVLIMHFPTLTLIWSPDCAFSSEVFTLLKKDQLEPDRSVALRGLDIQSGSEVLTEEMLAEGVVNSKVRAAYNASCATNVVAVDLLQKIPKMSEAATNRAVRRSLSLKHLMSMEKADLEKILGTEEAKAFDVCLSTQLTEARSDIIEC